MRTRGQLVAIARSEHGDAGRVVGSSLKTLRETLGITQDEMATRLGVGQAAISKIEHHGDVQISLLQRYVAALGGRLKIHAAFATADGSEAIDTDTVNENQLVLPIFGDDAFRPQRDVVLSIRPYYSERIMDGRKTVELRRRFPVSAANGTLAYIYSTSPVRSLVGSAEIADVVKLPTATLWKRYRNKASIEKPDFDGYFEGLAEGFALEFKNVRPLPRPIDLAELRERFGFEPPQSFLYAKPSLRMAVVDEYAKVSH